MQGCYGIEENQILKDFWNFLKHIPVADVRSPSEFMTGHIPGAVNIPLFDDNERAAVGTKYKKEGRIPAILEGLKLTGLQWHQNLNRHLKASKTGSCLFIAGEEG